MVNFQPEKEPVIKVMTKNLTHKLELIFIIGLGCATIAAVDTLTPPEVPIDALYTLPIWFGLVEFGLGGGLAVATLAVGLFYVANYLVAHDALNSLGPSILLTYLLLVLFTYGAYRYLLGQRQLHQTRLDLQARLEELDQLYRQSQSLHEQAVKLAVTEERNRLAREIHDVLAQGLAAIIFQVEAAYVSRQALPTLEQHLEQIRTLAQHNLAEARRSVANLRPLPLDETSLGQALERKVSEFGRSQPIQAVFASSGAVQRLSSEVEQALYRIAGEALTNVARHSQASQVEVRLDYDEEEVCLTIEDNGRGFEVNPGPADKTVAILEGGRSNSSGGFGLSTMQERASLVGGWATITSQAGQGCRVRVIVPYAKAVALDSAQIASSFGLAQ